MVTVLDKSKRVKLKGEALKRLNRDIHLRDGYSCIVCGQYVEEGIKFHHEPCNSSKSDEIEKGVTLCNSCHYERHHGKRLKEVKSICEQYLRALYGDSNE